MNHLENFGIGIDIVNVERFKKKPYNSNQSFYKKIFHYSEIKYCLKFKNSHEHFAGKFALKEAVIKSVSEPLLLLNIKTSSSHSKPKVTLIGKNINNYKFIASISHEKHLAISVVISQKFIRKPKS